MIRVVAYSIVTFTLLTFSTLFVFAGSDSKGEPGMELPTPMGDVILRVTGDIDVTNSEDGQTAEFDFDMLQALGAEEIVTRTIWTNGEQTFTGVLLNDLLNAVGADVESVRAYAVNDYKIDIPASDWAGPGPIIAYLQNGKPMPLRRKGPLWIIYPYDEFPQFKTKVTYARSVWQLAEIRAGE
ncbi:molybdopterin-dependent oxidoreductase [Palleronia caenipelagi]|uniref:Oxidoreductase n=1 Tax=Palleronia caenipelagi TaxID=2489174 RepID=A0A547Q2Q8_9RHOB|nr:molybdopterin-dependent oxidoreductase [Palleronia caenipelagi]TRD20676.1 oxidoreductase [Palleronia caenipelagi]